MSKNILYLKKSSMLADLPGQPQGGWVISGQSQIRTPAGTPAGATTDARGVVEEGDDTLIGLGNGKQAPPGCLGPRGAHPLLRAVKSGCPVDWSFGRAWGWSSLLLPDLRVDLGRLRWPV
ncbi:hypothetical protein PO909_029928 [Leuciscus waleckii]